MTEFRVISAFVFLSHLTKCCSLLFKSVCMFVYRLTLPLRKNLLGSKRKANNYYFAFILQVL